LAQLGLVERGTDSADARVVRPYPTAAARARHARLRDRRDIAVAHALNALAPSDRAAIERAVGPLSRLLETLERTDGRS
jgi:DNA-binding MarR family transcriptional regulator